MTMFTRPAILATAAALVGPAALAYAMATDLTGTWNFKVVTENGTGTPIVTITQTGDSLTGTYESGRMGIVPFRGTVKGNGFTFALNTSGGATLTFVGTIVNDSTVKGDVDFGGQGGATFTGERKR